VRRLVEAARARLDPASPFNDLASAAARVAPQLAENLRELTALAERTAHVAGSGSTLFVLCDDALHAKTLARAAQERLSLPAVAAETIVQPGF